MDREITTLATRVGLILVISGIFVSCESPERNARSELKRANVEATSTALVNAVSAGDSKVVDALLILNVSTESRDGNGKTPLRLAVEKGDLPLVASLISHRSDVDSKAAVDGRSILEIAIERQFHDIAGQLLAAGARAEPSLPTQAESVGWSDLLPNLVTAGADPNVPDQAGILPLALAINREDTQLIAALLKSGADPNREIKQGVTFAELAFLHPNSEVFGVFVEHSATLAPERKATWLWSALERQDADLAQRVLSRGASPQMRHHGLLPMEWAARQSSRKLVKLISDYGGNPGRSLMLATLRGDVMLVKLLVDLGSDPNEVSPPLIDRPLSAAIRGGHDAVGSALVTHGAALDFTLPEGQSPLHLAVVKGCPRTVQSLLLAGMDANAPFQLPVRPEFLRQVRPGALRWSLKNDTNVNLMMVAADSGDTATARQLLRSGAKTETWTKTARLWPINFASRRGDVKMMRLILGRDPQRVERRIVIRIGEQRASLFDIDGKEIFSTKVSTGKKGHDTPTGEYVITNKYREWKSTLYEAKMPYFQRLSCGDFGLHAGNVPGYPASHGCIRVPAENAVKLFAMTQAGDRVCIMP